MGLRRGKVALSALITAGWSALALPTAGQSPDELQAWFDREWSRARQPVPFSNVEINYVAETHEVPPIAEVERLREAVRGHPDHPDRDRLRGYERRMDRGPDRFPVTVWLGDAGHWRMNWSDPSGDWCDTAKHSKGAWRLGADQLTLLGMVDGSAIRPAQRSLGPQYPSGHWSPGFPTDIVTDSIGPHGLHTVDGVRGRDIR